MTYIPDLFCFGVVTWNQSASRDLKPGSTSQSGFSGKVSVLTTKSWMDGLVTCQGTMNTVVTESPLNPIHQGLCNPKAKAGLGISGVFWNGLFISTVLKEGSV